MGWHPHEPTGNPLGESARDGVFSIFSRLGVDSWCVKHPTPTARIGFGGRNGQKSSQLVNPWPQRFPPSLGASIPAYEALSELEEDDVNAKYS